MEQMRQYPIGIQDFKEIRENGWLYVDKTEYVYRMTHTAARYYFLSRPRRFGKSLLVSTLECYFEGRKELFRGLAIDKMETAWEKYPVLHFDFSKAKNLNLDQLARSIGVQIEEYEDIYGKKDGVDTLGDRLGLLFKNAYAKTGKKVVLLVDEYDAPFLDVAHDKGKMIEVRRLMANFYSNLKGGVEYLRFVFLTGISKFSQIGLFSGLNNVKDISMLEQYGAICGITKEELTGQLARDIDMLAKNLGLAGDVTLERLVNHYDGYHFTWPSEDIFNPYSILNAFFDGKINDYWFETATSSSLIELLRTYDVLPTEVGRMEKEIDEFNVPIEDATDCYPLLYQSGYLTIKGFNKGFYILDAPNEEVKKGLMKCLMMNYLPNGFDSGLRKNTARMRDALETDDIEAAMKAMKEVLEKIPYTRDISYEGHYQQLFFSFFSLAGADVRLEERTASGRIDLEMRTKRKLYIVELKLDSSAQEAMNQIVNNGYAAKFLDSGLPIVKVGVNIDSKMRTINQVLVIND